MTRANKLRKKKSRIVAEKNKIRGVIGAGRSRSYTPESVNKAALFQRKLSDALVTIRATGGIGADSFIQWVGKQTSAQLPQFKSAPVDSGLSPTALTREPRDLQVELRWVAKLLASNSAVLTKFRSQADQLEEAALLGETALASSLLDRIESDHGKSIWWLEAKIALEQSHRGLEAQKQVVTIIRKQNPKSLPAYLGRFFSIRNEPTTTLNSFFADASDRIGRIKQTRTLQSYLRFKLLWNSSFSQRELAAVMFVAQGLSIVDLYETFLDVAQHAYVFNYTPSLKECLDESLTTLGAIPDARVSKFSILLGQASPKPLEHRPYGSLRQLLRGNYTRGVRLALREVLKSPRAFKSAVYAANVFASISRVDENTKDRWQQVIRRVSALLEFNDDYASAWLDLEKFLRNWSFSPTSKACFFALKCAMTDDAEVRYQCKQLTAINNAYLDYDEISLYPEHIKDSIIAREPPALELSAPSDSDSLQPFICEASKQFVTYFRAQAAADLSLADEMGALDKEAAQLGSRRLAIIVRRLYLASLIDAQRIGPMLDSAVHAYFDLRIPPGLLPLAGDFARLRWRQLRPFATKLSLPIVLHLSWRASGSDQVGSNLRYAYNDFLSSHGIKSVSEISRRSTTWPREQLIYFLRFVCIPEVLDMSAEVMSSRGANEVRREVCALLIQLDPENKVAYETETFSITRDLSVQDGMRVLDSSRVHVDTGAITSWATRELEPNIARYKALVEAGIGVSESLSEVFKELNAKPGTSKKFLELPDSDADLILADLITSLRTKFLSDPNHGLDSYLSRRVRHHSMSGYLRGAVENENLVTTKDHLTGRYVENAHWPTRVPGITDSENRQLQRALGRFCEEFDRIILELKGETLRIKSPEHPKGIFSISVSPPMFHLIRGATQQAYTVEELCSVCFSIFWAALNPALEEARSALKVRTYHAISSAFHRLKAALRKTFNDPQRYTALSVAIQAASDDLNRKVVRISDWFNRSESTQSNQTFTLEQALDISIQAALYSLKPFSPDIEQTVEPGRTVSAIMLVQLSDLILTMLGNVRQHSHLESGRPPKVAISLTTKEDTSFLLRIESDVGPRACSPTARRRVDAIRQEISEGTHMDRVRNEGNSGLMKIASVAGEQPSGKFDCGFIADKRFFVWVQCESPGILELAVPSPRNAA